MSSDQFEVTTASLRAAAGNLGDRAETAGGIADCARAADVGAKSWGGLGLGLGLYAGYTAVRDSADHGIGAVQTFLTDAKTALESSARDYDEADHAGGRMFSDIGNGLGGAS
jgi:uncharacterized protein YukE